MPYMIMITDDDYDFRCEFREMLEQEYEVIEASDGEEAMRKLSAPNIIDMVLLDVKMPGMQGPEVLKKMKVIQPDLLIIMITGYGSKETMLDSLKGHADDFLEKPLKIDAVMRTIKSLLTQKNREAGSIIMKLKYFLERNYHKNISLKDAAEIVFLSPKYISRIFRDEVGVGFGEYKLGLRMDKAKELLDNSDLHVGEISWSLGYQNTESFIKIFKKMVNSTPGEYRRRKL
ncbi:MAG: response regulator transcription factor [Spirochaetales bacterium]|nr:response regulator transcription factor [Spirochaetales bacterium]